MKRPLLAALAALGFVLAAAPALADPAAAPGPIS